LRVLATSQPPWIRPMMNSVLYFSVERRHSFLLSHDTLYDRVMPN
jgi:hypothetical protein